MKPFLPPQPLHTLAHGSRSLARRWTLALGACLLATAPAAWAAGCEMQPMTLPVHLVEWRPVATVTVNGQSLNMLVDSGAASSLLTPSAATELKLPLQMLPFGSHVYGYTGSMEANRTRVKALGVGAAELKNVEFLVAGSELGNGIKGVLGRDILALGDTEYDLAHGVVRLVFPKGDCEKVSMAYWAGEAPVIVAPFAADRDRSSDAALVQVSINGTRMSALMDTGAPGTTLSLASARKAGIDPGRMKPAGRASGLGEDKVNRWLADVDSFQIGGEKMTHQRLMVDDVDHDHHDMLLGLDYFLAHRIYVSRLQGKVYATWNGTDVFAQHPGAARNNFDTRYALKPDDLPADDADALARRGMAFQTKGDLPRALEDLNRAIALKPSEAAFLLARARVKLSLREQDAAMTDLDEVLRLDATQTEARLLRADLRIEHHDIEAAQADLRALDAELPPSAAQRARMGDLYAAMDQVAPAVKQYELWLEHHDSDGQQAQVLAQRCWLRTRMGVDLPVAVKDCQRAISKDPDVAIYRSNLGWAFLRLGDSQSALAAFNKAIEMNARLGWAFYGRALTEIGLKDTTSAERDLHTARRLRPGIDQAVRQAGFRLPEGLQAPANEAAGADKG